MSFETNKAVKFDAKAYKRLVIKIGSSLLVDADALKLRQDWLQSLVVDIARLHAEGIEVVLVSSGAVSLGRQILGLSKPQLGLDQSQAAAAVGQIALNQAYKTAFESHEIAVGQILITPDITEHRRRYLNARTTISTLLEMKVVPIINENDSVVTQEIRYGDNDRLSARIATMIEADGLIILSDVDGLYTAPPGADGEHVGLVQHIDDDVRDMAGGARSHLSSGGMATKIEAAHMATRAGTSVIITKGSALNPISRLSDGGKHTLFAAATNRAEAKKAWIMGTLEPAGIVVVDEGAARALQSGKSLLPVGVVEVKGSFERGDAVTVLNAKGDELARGLIGFDAVQAVKICGVRSEKLRDILGSAVRDEMIHRDNMIVYASKGDGV